MNEINEFIKKYKFVGISGPQGCGKTTISDQLDAIVLHLDDFYYPYRQLQLLSALGNPFYRNRGLPGTHDIDTLLYSIQSLSSGQQTQVPVYNKSLHNGKGDRDGMVIIKPNRQCIVLEGWCVGFLPTEIAVQEWFTLKDVEQINKKLQQYTKIWNLMDAIVHIKTMDIENVYEWRLEQEIERNQGMSKSQIIEFIEPFMPWYACSMINKPALLIIIDKNRQILHSEVLHPSELTIVT